VTSLLEMAGVHAGYGGAAVLRGFDLHVDAGEVVALLGANGAGKTTTLLTAAGFLSTMQGEVRVLGRSTQGRRPQDLARDGLAFVPEDRSLFFSLTVAENLKLGTRGGDVTPVFHHFPALEALMDRRAGLLSGGEQQMLAVGRALLTKPKLLMVDEMSLGLAPIIVQQLLPIVRTVADETGAGVLLVEQHVNLALEVADRAVVLAHGDIVLEGDAAQLQRDRHLLESSDLGESAIDDDPLAAHP